MEAELMLANDVERVEDLAEANFPWFKSLDWTRKDVIISMIFNLGFQGFLGFRKMTIAISEGKFEQAATEMLDSKWAIQVGRRAYELSEMMRLGEYLK